jgi:hypothetical protein
MADDFRVAGGYVEVVARVNERTGRDAAERITRDVEQGLRASGPVFDRASGDIGRNVGAGISRGIEGEVEKGFRRTRDRVRKSGDDSAKGFLSGFGSAFSGAFLNTLTFGLKGSGSLASAFSDNPYVAAIGAALAVAIVATAAPAIGAGIVSAVSLASGIGVIGLGALLLKENPAVKAAGASLMKTLKDTFTDAAQPLVRPLVDSLGDARSMVRELAPEFKEMFAVVAPYVRPLVDGFLGLVKNALPGFLDFLKSSGPSLTVFAQKLPEIGTALTKMFDSFAKGGPGATAFLGDFLQWVSGIIIGVGAVVGWLSQAYLSVRNFFTSIPGWAKSAGDWFDKTWDKITGFFSGIWRTVTGSVSKGTNDTVSWFSALPGRVGRALVALPGHRGRSDVGRHARNGVRGWLGSRSGSGLGGVATGPMVGNPVRASWPDR